MKESFNPSNEQYKKVEDLPEEQQSEFVDIPKEEGGGFVGKEAAAWAKGADSMAKREVADNTNDKTEKEITGKDVLHEWATRLSMAVTDIMKEVSPNVRTENDEVGELGYYLIPFDSKEEKQAIYDNILDKIRKRGYSVSPYDLKIFKDDKKVGSLFVTEEGKELRWSYTPDIDFLRNSA